MAEQVLKSRVTVVETVYHQHAGESATSIESRFARNLETQEQLYQRRLKIGKSWTPLDCGWLEEVSMLVIHNEEGQNLLVHPTPEEKEKTNAKVIEVSHTPNPNNNTSWIIPPGESMRACPASIRDLYLRCRCGEARVTLNAIPK